MAAQDYYQQYLQQVVGGMMPNINRQKKGMYDYMLQQGLRTGVPAARIAEGMRPYAEAAGDAAAKSSGLATQMAQKQKQFDVQQENWRRQFEQGQKNWEAQMAARQEQQDLANMLAMFEYTGWTPELLDAMGYSGLDKARMLQAQRQVGDLGFRSPSTTMGYSGGSGATYSVGYNHPLARSKAGMLYA